MNINKLNTKAKQEIILKVANYLVEIAEDNNQRYVDEEELHLTLELLVEYYLNPLSAEDYFGTEGWEHFFNV